MMVPKKSGNHFVRSRARRWRRYARERGWMDRRDGFR